MYSINMVGSSQPVTGVGIGDPHGETAATDRDQNDVEHLSAPNRTEKWRFSDLRSYDTKRPKGQYDRQRYGQMDSHYQADLAKHLAGPRKPERRPRVGWI
jgi:hypothetical protein